MSFPHKTILVYAGIDLIGDAMFKLPLIRHLRACYPDAHITWLAGQGRSSYAHEVAPLVHGLLDEVLEQANIGRSPRELMGPCPLSDRQFDLVIDTQKLVLTTLILRRIHHQVFLSAAANFLFSDIRPEGWPFSSGKPPSVAAHLQRLGELATGCPMASVSPLPVEASSEREAERILPSGRTYIGFAPGAGGQHKCWPFDKFIVAAAAQIALGRIPVFLLGPNEANWEQKVRNALPEALIPLQDTRQHITPMLTIALARKLSAAVANDAGIGHIMAAADVPLISLFGPTQAQKFAPTVSRLFVLQAQNWGGEDMNRIPVAAVLDAIEVFVSPPQSARP